MIQTQIELWKKNVWDKQEEVDPGNERDWADLALGYFIGLGMSIEEAEDSVREASKQGLI